MAEPEDIISFIENDIVNKLPLYGKKILITAGPTYEAIDPKDWEDCAKPEPYKKLLFGFSFFHAIV